MKVENSSFIPHPSSLGFGRWLDWLYPPRCRFCRASVFDADECFCRSCRERIRRVTHPLCPSCGRPFLDTSGDDHLCGKCIARRPHFVRACAWACYPTEDGEEHPLREVVQRFKYGRKVSLGKPLGRLMAVDCREFFDERALDVILPVPLHPKRLRWRGFNQSVILAREIGRRPRLLLAAQPTRGLDPGATRFVIEQVLALRDAGAAVLYVSTELEEVLAVADRIGVMCGGRLVGMMWRDEADLGRIGLMMAGALDETPDAERLYGVRG